MIMLRRLSITLFLFCDYSFATIKIAAPSMPEMKRIGYAVWRNEAGCSHDKLTWWNEREDFASLGIGHFIWYPADKKPSFEQSFPLLLDYFVEQNYRLPAWLAKSRKTGCPWKNRKIFFNEFGSVRMNELRALLVDTVDLQVQFLVARFFSFLPKIVEQAPRSHRLLIESRIERLAKSPNGLYALMDYMNWKGGGTSSTERYKKQGWGLLQVLMTMRDTKGNVVQEFACAARTVLKKRVAHASRERHEEKWLPGWLNRIDTYVQPLPLNACPLEGGSK